jgi:hypothetical protein
MAGPPASKPHIVRRICSGLLSAYRCVANEAKNAEGLIAVIGLVLLILAAQWTAQQAASAKQSTDAAMEALRLQKQSSLLHDRPWLVSWMSQYPEEIEPTKDYVLEWQLKNVGELPAVGMIVKTRSGIVPMGSNLDLEFGNRPSQVPSRTVVGPGELKPTRLSIKLDAAQVDGVRSQKLRLYAIGEIIYSWPDGSKGVLTFCTSHDPVRKVWVDCEIFNDMH